MIRFFSDEVYKLGSRFTNPIFDGKIWMKWNCTSIWMKEEGYYTVIWKMTFSMLTSHSFTEIHDKLTSNIMDISRKMKLNKRHWTK